MLKRIPVICLIVLLMNAPESTFAKEYDREPLASEEFFIGIKTGLSDIWGDVGTRSRTSHYFNGLYFQKIHYMAGLFAQYSITPWLATRIEGSAGTLYATDAWNVKDANKDGPGSTSYYLYLRNQDIKTTIVEGLFSLELTPLKLFPNSPVSRWLFQPFVSGGIGFFHFNPKTSYTDRSGNMSWVATHPLHLESEGLDLPNSPAGYKLTQMCVPVGAGIRYALNDHWLLGIEYLLRVTQTDYLDGVSNLYVNPGIFSSFLSESDAEIATRVADKRNQIDPSGTFYPGDVRGNPKSKDAYSTFGFQLMWRLPSKRDRF